jgi:hypothetical protein
MVLNVYVSQTQRLLHDPQAQYFSVSDLTSYINTARSQIAIESQSVRVLISGYVSAIAVGAGGAGYSASSTISIAGGSGGSGAVFTPTIGGGGAITGATLVAPGSGYDNLTVAQLVDPTGAGSGAVLTPTVLGQNLMVVGQEVYTFASRNAAAQLTPGVSAVHGVFSIATSWGSSKPTLRRKTWGEFQALYRAWSNGWLNNPCVWAQYGQGSSGSIYFAPIPSSAFSMDWDTFCNVLPLASDTDPEALPYPWTDAVQYYTAYLAYANAQRSADAASMFEQYGVFMRRARALSETPFIPSQYDDE